MMNKKQILDAITELRKEKKRNFSQTIDLQISLHNLDLKKQESKVDIFVTLPKSRGKKVSVCALVGGVLLNDAKANCDHIVQQEEFKGFKGKKKEIKQLVRAYDFFIAQADIMPAVATTFGRYLGPAGKMPNPKAGAIVPPKGSTKPIVEKLQRTIRISVKGELAVKCPVGKEDMSDEDLVENIYAAYNAFSNALPQHEQNIKQTRIKFTMSKAVVIGGKK